MNRTQLTAFAAVAEAGGFTKGAERLMVSQPAVSLQVSELETSLKTKLFDRLPRGVRLTAAGELLLGYARRIEAMEQEAELAMAEFLGLARGRLIIGASLTIGSYLLPATLGAFRQAHPQIDLELKIANTHQIEAMVLDNRLDMAFTEGFIRDHRLKARVIARDRLVPIAPPNHPMFSLKRITAERFMQEPLILREAGSGTREVVEEALRRRRLTLTPGMSLGSTEAIKRAVEAGVGVAIVSELTIGTELAAGTLRVVPVVDLPIVRPLHQLRPPGKTDSPAAEAFIELLMRRADGKSPARAKGS